MKIKDYWRLAKISLKARKKSTNSTVGGVAISLIIMVPLIFTMIGINQNLLAKLNSNPEQLYATFYSAESGDNAITESEYNLGSGSYWVYNNSIYTGNGNQAYADHSAYFENSDIETLHYSIHNKENGNMHGPEDPSQEQALFEKIYINGTEKHHLFNTNKLEHGYRPNAYTSLAVYEEKNIDKLNKTLSKYFVENCNGGFTEDGKKQVIVSKKYLSYAKLKPEDVYNKNISVYYKDFDNRYGNNNVYYKDGDNLKQLDRSFSHYLFQDFKVVGVLDSEDYDLGDIRGASIIVTGASYYNNKKAVLAPNYGKLNVIDINGNEQVVKGYDIGDYNEKNKLTTEYVFPGVEGYFDKAKVEHITNAENNNGQYEEGKTITSRVNVYLYIAKDYANLEETLKLVQPEYIARGNNPDIFASEVASVVYTNFLNINKIFTFATLIGGIFGGVVLFAALVNLFNTIKHSVDSRKNYLGVMRAIGAEDATIPKLYFFEVMRIFLRAYIEICILGGGICFGIMVALYYMSLYLPLSFTISWVNIPIVLGVVALLLLIVGLVYSVGCSYSLSKKPITELLEG